MLLQALLLLLWGVRPRRRAGWTTLWPFGRRWWEREAVLPGGDNGGLRRRGPILSPLPVPRMTMGALSFPLTAPETIAGISGTVQSRGKADLSTVRLWPRPSGRRQGEPGHGSLCGGRELAHRLHHQRGQGGNGLRLTVDNLGGEPLTVDTWLTGKRNTHFCTEVCYNDPECHFHFRFQYSLMEQETVVPKLC